ncbi:MAG TPA: DUF262 domain-containing protein [Candidatus Saccharimonadales bacterium]
MKITPDNQNLFTLVEKAQKKQLVLPDFQRSFVWPYTAIKDILISIFKGYYIGSILLLDADSKSLPFAFRPIEGVDGVAEDDLIQKYILDGQQRITTLHYVLYAPEKVNLKYTSSPYRFFLNLEHFMAGDLEQAIYGLRAQDCRRLVESPEQQFKQKIVPFTSLTQNGWQEWLQQYVNVSEDDAEKAKRAVEVLNWSNKLHGFFNFQTTSMTLDKVAEDDEAGVAEICAVFEKMNSTGVKLTVFDLLTARLYRSNISLRQLWQDAYQQNENLNAFSDDDPGVYAVLILRVIGLLRGLDVKASNLINLSPQNFVEDFERATSALDKALQKIRSSQGYGAFEKKWLPYPSMAAPLAALIDLSQTEKLDSTATKAIDRWYWGSVFNERYSSAVESVTARDYRDIRDYLTGKKAASDVLGEISLAMTEQNIMNKLYATNRTRSSVYSGVMCLTANNGARDFRLDDPITLHTLDDHHIFPKNYLAKHYKKSDIRLTDNQINCILNKTLISDRTNRKISNKAPSEYIKDTELVDTSQTDLILSKHFINAAARDAMQADDFGAFQGARCHELVREIIKRTT